VTTSHGEALRISGASKNYGPTRALVDVSFAVRHGRIHALLGGNGSGKSTLVKVLAGVVRPEPGGSVTRVIGDRTVETSLAHVSASVARELGFRFVHQDSPIFPELSIADNLALGSMYERGPAGGISWRRQYARARKVLAQFGLDASPREPVSGLAPAARTLLAIVRALQDQPDPSASVLVLDEPTATLPRNDVAWLLASLRRLADQGQTILWVSHRLDEVCQAADDVTVLRDGRHVTTGPLGTRTTADLAELIVGGPVPRAGSSEVSDSAGRVLEVRGLSSGAVDGVDLDVSQGEIVGLVGLIGSGRSSVLRAIYGALPRRAGTVTVSGKPLRGGHIPTARAMGVRFLPEERRLIAFSDMSVAINASTPDVRRFWRGWIDRRAERRSGEGLIEQFGVRAPSADAALNSLSGGNQQKVLVGAAIRSDPTVLLVDEPTQGVDVGARADIHSLIKQAISGRGCAVVVSSDLEEVVDICDRVLILAGGRIVAELVGDEITELAIASHMDKGTHTTQPDQLDTLASTLGSTRSR
jgi:ribose transport system ATP-binding protein